MKKVWIMTTALAVALAAFGSYKYLYKPDHVVVMDAEQAFDVTNKELLVGWADDVFVGTVELKEKESKDEVGPYTVYKVKVEETIKGSLKGSVAISQRIGYDNNKKALFKFEGDDYLVANKKYLFVSKYDAKTKTHRIVPVHGDIVLDTSEKESKVKQEFKEAKKNEKNPFN
jgi:hypothetical protein